MICQHDRLWPATRNSRSEMATFHVALTDGGSLALSQQVSCLRDFSLLAYLQRCNLLWLCVHIADSRHTTPQRSSKNGPIVRAWRKMGIGAVHVGFNQTW